MCVFVSVASKAFEEYVAKPRDTHGDLSMPRPCSESSRSFSMKVFQDDFDKRTQEEEEVKLNKMLYAVVCACAAKL